MNSKVQIIAEVGVNHNGSIQIAKKLIDIAKDAGANFVKFQIYKTSLLVTKKGPLAKYQKKNSLLNNQYDLLKKYEFSFEKFLKIIDYCKKKKIKFLGSPFDEESAKFLNKHTKIFKIPSGEITNFPLLSLISSFNKDIILSTGASTINEVSEALKIIKKKVSSKKITILHCNSEYPSIIKKDINLKSLLFLKKKFNCKIGYSDHTPYCEVPIIATSLGSTIIEKHFTLNKKMKGPDHSSSLNPIELKKMIRSIRITEELLGNFNKKVSSSEKKNRNIIRKSIYAKKNIKIGELFDYDNIVCKRPYKKSHPKIFNFLINKKAKKNFKIDDEILNE